MGSLVTTRQAVTAVEEEAQYLTFMLGGEMFAIGILGIKEIIEYGSLTVVPMMPAFVRGVINLRGAVVPVVDLSARFGRQNSEITRRSCVIIIEASTKTASRRTSGCWWTMFRRCWRYPLRRSSRRPISARGFVPTSSVAWPRSMAIS